MTAAYGIRRTAIAWVFLALSCWFGNKSTLAAMPSAEMCGALTNGYGPLDYRTDRDGMTLTRVEIPHFPPEVEALLRGKSGYLGGDIDYTLRAFPNHHRALIAIVKWGVKTKSLQPPTLPRPIECYFERAIRFRPDDNLVHMIYATFLQKNDRLDEARQQLRIAAAAAADNPFTHYNIGLIYFDMKDYDDAARQAQAAYSLGFGQPALRDQLKSVGKWVEPPAEAASATDGAASGAVPTVPASATPAASAASGPAAK